MTQLCTTYNLNQQSDRLDYFQQMILNGLRYWQEHPAIQTIDDAVLEFERDGILNALTRGLQFEPAWPMVRGLIERLAAYMERRGYWTPWRVVLEQAITLSQRVGDIAGETTMTALLARLSQRQSRGADVVRYYRRAMRLAKQSDNQYELARASCNLGYYYIDTSRWWRSEVLSLRALEIFEALESDHGRAHTHNHLGLLYTRQEQWDAAKKNLDEACQIWSNNREQHNLITAYLNLGVMHIEKGELLHAFQNLESADQLAKLIGDMSVRARIWNNMAVAYQEEMQWMNAERYAKMAEEIFRKNSDKLGVASTAQNLGIIYANLDQPTRAMQYFNEAITIHREMGNRVGEERTNISINRHLHDSP